MENQEPSPLRSRGRGCIFALAVLAILIAIAAACIIYTPHNRFPSAALEALTADKNAVIYSLRPMGPSNLKDNDRPGFFRGHEIIGQTQVSSSEDRALFAGELARSTQGRWDAAACFDPRHAFRASGPSGTFDFLLCYQCGRALVIGPDGRVKQILMGGKPDALNQYLTRHGIALE